MYYQHNVEWRIDTCPKELRDLADKMEPLINEETPTVQLVCEFSFLEDDKPQVRFYLYNYSTDTKIEVF